MPPGSNFFETTDIFIVTTLVIGGFYYLYRTTQSKSKDYNLLSKQTKQVEDRSVSPAYSASKTVDGIFTVDKKDIVVIYGSQTGTAEEYAERLVKEGNKYGFQCLAIDPEEYEMADLCKIPKDKLVIFVLATYGEGEPTDNAVSLKEYLTEQLQSSSEDQILSNLTYAIFGLGNRTYEKFNATARFVDKSLTQLGGHRVGSRGEGNDADNLEDDFNDWAVTMWNEVATMYKIDLEQAASKAKVLDCAYSLTELLVDDKPAFVYKGELNDPNQVNFDMKNPFPAKLVQSIELFSPTEPDGRNCLHMEFELQGSKLNYQPGDHLAIWPTNDQNEIDVLAKALNLTDKLDTVITMKAIDLASRKKHPFPCPTTYRAALTHYLDIHVPPKAHILSSWLPYCDHESTLPYYQQLCTDKQFYTDQVSNQFKSVGELLTAYPIPTLPLNIVLDGFQRIQPRYYSISSSARYVDKPTLVHITVSILRFTCGTKQVHGLATKFLFNLHLKFINQQPVPLVPLMVRQSNFKLPRLAQVPILMIGPGTGVAPMRGFIQERCAIQKRVANLGASYLFFGCRFEKHDYIYAQEWMKYIDEGGLTGLETAFSRDTSAKVYVQHKLEHRADLVYDLIFKQNGVIYVCGDGKYMVKDVYQFFVQLVCTKNAVTSEKAALIIKELRDKGRYQEDVWS